MKLHIVRSDGRFRLYVDEGGTRWPVLRAGEVPSWAGGWAGVDGTGAYDRAVAVQVLVEFGVRQDAAESALDRACGA